MLGGGHHQWGLPALPQLALQPRGSYSSQKYAKVELGWPYFRGVETASGGAISVWYTHKTSGFKTSGKRPVFKFDILIKQKV